MAKKVTIHQFDPVIYPFKLWVVISNNLPEIESNFIEGKTFEHIDLGDIEEHADAYLVECVVDCINQVRTGKFK